MKTTIITLKSALILLLLMMTQSASAQLIGLNQPAGLAANLSGTGTTAIFVSGDAGFTLLASPTSTDEGGEEGITFTDFDWFFKNSTGGEDGVSALTSASAVPEGEVNNELNVTGLAPGFYTFVAQGKTANDVCLAPKEEFTVFVLRPITVTVASTDPDLLYCTDDLAENVLTATATYNADTVWNTQTNLAAELPDLDDFQLRYRWYKVDQDEAFNIGTATAFRTETPTSATTTDSYTFAAPADTEVGRWKYYVAVDYTVKPSGPYTGALGGVTTPTIIEVTPKPGKPTISISAN